MSSLRSYTAVDGTVYSITPITSSKDHFSKVHSLIRELYGRYLTTDELVKYLEDMHTSVEQGTAFKIELDNKLVGFTYLKRGKGRYLHCVSIWADKDYVIPKMLILHYVTEKYGVIQYSPIDGNVQPMLGLLNVESVKRYRSRGANIITKNPMQLPSEASLCKFFGLIRGVL